MRTVIAQIYDYSLDGIILEEGTGFFDFCCELPDDPANVDRTRDFYQNADVLIMGRNHYQGAAQYFPGAADPPTPPPSTQRARSSSVTRTAVRSKEQPSGSGPSRRCNCLTRSSGARTADGFRPAPRARRTPSATWSDRPYDP